MGTYDYKGKSIDTIKPLDSYGDLSTASGFYSAITAFMSDNKTTAVIIPYGNYNLESAVSISSNKIIYGNNAKITGYGGRIFALSNVSNIIVQDLIIDMNQDKDSGGGDAFYMIDVNNITIKDVTIKNIGARGFLIYNADTTTGRNNNIVIDGVVFEGIGEAQTGESEWPTGIIAVNCVDSKIINCKASGLIGFTLEFKNYCSNCRISNNLIKGGRRGINLGSDLHGTVEDAVFENIVMNDNIVTNNAFPLCIGKVKNSVISGNYLSGRTNLIVSCDSVMISNNYFNGELSDEEAYQDALFQINAGKDIFLTNNVYNRNDITDLFYILNSPDNVIFQGIFEGTEIDIVDPQSGTPTVS